MPFPTLKFTSPYIPLFPLSFKTSLLYFLIFYLFPKFHSKIFTMSSLNMPFIHFQPHPFSLLPHSFSYCKKYSICFTNIEILFECCLILYPLLVSFVGLHTFQRTNTSYSFAHPAVFSARRFLRTNRPLTFVHTCQPTPIQSV